MTRTVTAFFDSRSEAEAARTRLTESSIDAENIQIIDKSGASGGSDSMSGSEGQGFWASIKEAFMPEEDGHAYEEGMRRGGYLLCARVDERAADAAIRVLEESDSVDFDRRQDEWRQDGWAGFTGGSGFGSDQSSRETGRVVEEERIPIVEEELRVGKREVARGGARVRSYVRETPVHEQVNLREEHVSVERRPVDQRLSSAELGEGDALRDRTIEMTETAEEAVVAKEARVREELVVRKTEEERVENIDETVRNTEVDVDEGLDGGRDRSAFGFRDNDSSGAGTSASTGSTAFSDSEREREGAGYSPPIDKSGL